jgi:hypothetical protein
MRIVYVALVAVLLGGTAVAQSTGGVDAYGNPIYNDLPRFETPYYQRQFNTLDVPYRDPSWIDTDMTNRRRGQDQQQLRRDTPDIPDNAP